jgi:hypothetical protein
MSCTTRIFMYCSSVSQHNALTGTSEFHRQPQTSLQLPHLGSNVILMLTALNQCHVISMHPAAVILRLFLRYDEKQTGWRGEREGERDGSLTQTLVHGMGHDIRYEQSRNCSDYLVSVHRLNASNPTLENLPTKTCMKHNVLVSSKLKAGRRRETENFTVAGFCGSWNNTAFLAFIKYYYIIYFYLTHLRWCRTNPNNIRIQSNVILINELCVDWLRILLLYLLCWTAYWDKRI